MHPGPRPDFTVICSVKPWKTMCFLQFFAKALSKIQRNPVFLRSFVQNLIRNRRQPRASTLSWMRRSQNWPPESVGFQVGRLYQHHRRHSPSPVPMQKSHNKQSPCISMASHVYFASQFTCNLQQLRLRPSSTTATGVTGPDAATRGRLRP